MPTQTSEIYYQTSTGINMVANVFTPDVVQAQYAVALVWHVGGYKAGNPELAVASQMASFGFLGIAPEYRLAPPHNEMNAPPHAAPGQNTVSDSGFYPEQTFDVQQCILHYRQDVRCNGIVICIGGSAGGSHTMFWAANGTPGLDMPDLAIIMSCGVSNLADPNMWAIDCTGFHVTCPHSAVANYLNIGDTFPLAPTGADLATAQAASPITNIHRQMCPVWVMCSTMDAIGIPTSSGYSIQSFDSTGAPGPFENGSNGLIPMLQAAGIPESTSAHPQSGTYKQTLVTVGAFSHAFDYWNLVRSAAIEWCQSAIPAVWQAFPSGTGSIFVPASVGFEGQYGFQPEYGFKPEFGFERQFGCGIESETAGADTGTPRVTMVGDTRVFNDGDNDVAFIQKASGAVPPPTGLWVLPSGGQINPTIFSSPILDSLDGVVIGCRWFEVEPSPGVYQFDTAAGDSLDDWIAQIEAVGLPARLTIGTAGPNQSAGGLKPDWLADPTTGMIATDNYTGGKFFKYLPDGITPTTIPVFWEPTLQARIALLYNAIAAHIRTHHLIKAVHIQYANAQHDDWNLGSITDTPDGLPDGLSPFQRWVNSLTGSPFASFADAITFAGNTAFANAKKAFKGRYHLNSIGRIDGASPSVLAVLNPNDTEGLGRNVSNSVVNTAIANNLGFIMPMKENLNGGYALNGNTGGVTPAPGGTSIFSDLYNFQHCYKALQATWQCYNDPETACLGDPGLPYLGQQMNWANGGCLGSTRMFKSAVDVGLTYGPAWIEMYENDFLNLCSPNNDPNPGTFQFGPNVIKYAHSILKRTLPPLT